jgi:DNA-directed RNA polymerase subunit RPC12/RpoP
MDEKIIKIANFDDYLRAEITKIALEREGIQCFLSGENFVATYWLYSRIEGGIKLYIKESDKQRAVEILENISRSENADADKTYDIRCPKCDSTDVRNIKYYRWFSVIIVLFLALLSPFLLILGLPLILLLSNRCETCGHKWK